MSGQSKKLSLSEVGYTGAFDWTRTRDPISIKKGFVFTNENYVIKNYDKRHVCELLAPVLTFLCTC